jgi:hypothetical protein
MIVKYFAMGILIGIILMSTASAQTNTDWQKANGGWIVVKNSHAYNTGGPFIPCTGQSGCRGYPIHVEHGICINSVVFDDPSIGASWNPPTNNIILAQDCGAYDWSVADCPIVTEYWVPAGTYTLTEFTYVSEVNPGDPNYSPCHNAWSKPAQTVVIKPGDRIDFGEQIFVGVGTCTIAGYPCPSGPLGGPLGNGSDACHHGWSGKWDSNWGEMVFQQAGSTVTATYTHDQGRIQGTVSGNKLTGTWSEAPTYSPPKDAGDVELTLSDDCNSFSGKWRYGSSGSWGDWTGKRITTESGSN